jgi:hypothetical protein
LLGDGRYGDGQREGKNPGTDGTFSSFHYVTRLP